MLALPLAREAAHERQRRRMRERRLRALVRGDEQWNAFDVGEPPDIQNHRTRRKGGKLIRCIADRASSHTGTPPARLLDQQAPPQRRAINLAWMKQPRIKPIRHDGEALLADAERAARAWYLRRRGDEEMSAFRRPPSQPLRPDIRVAPARGWPGLDGLQHQQLRAVD